MSASSQRALEEEQADERLRDAAPDLLEALKQLLHDHPVYSTKPIGGPGSQARNAQERAIEAEAMARSAIAKATGKQP